MSGAPSQAGTAMASLQGVMAWIGGHASALKSTVAAVEANQPEPARNVLAYTGVLLVLAWVLAKLVGKRASRKRKSDRRKPVPAGRLLSYHPAGSQVTARHRSSRAQHRRL